MTNIPDGYALIPGRGREIASQALKAAERAKVPSSEVKTTTDGYVVPEKVAKEYEKALTTTKEIVDEPKPVETPEPEKKAPAKKAAPAKKTGAGK
jgi:outer membrane biosynthesis protein TonB